MKKMLLLFGLFSLSMLLMPAFNAYSQDKSSDKPEFKKEIPERLRYYKEKYDTTYTQPFDIVWNAVQNSITETGCQIASKKSTQDDKGLYKGNIKSDNFVFVYSSDSTYTVLQEYSLDLPFIRGGVWVNGRIAYKFHLQELETNKVEVTLTSQMSGYESHVTDEMQYWKSNGKLETHLMEVIKNNIDKAAKK